MYEISMRYDNTDDQFRFDELIRLTMSKWNGIEMGCGQCLQNNTLSFGFEFEQEDDREEPCLELHKTLGDRSNEVEFLYPPKPEKVDSTLLTIDFAPDQDRMPREIISLLKSGLCSWWQIYTCNKDILCECRSLAAAYEIMTEIRSLDPNIKVSIIPEEEPQFATV